MFGHKVLLSIGISISSYLAPVDRHRQLQTAETDSRFSQQLDKATSSEGHLIIVTALTSPTSHANPSYGV